MSSAFLARMDARFRLEHARLAALSTRGRHEVVPGTSDYIHTERTESIIAAIEQVLREIQTK